HVIAGAILPMSWPVLRSMFTGWVSLEHVKDEHPGWLAELEGREAPEETAPTQATVAEARS
ncbi:MAG: hypothetical protein LLG24_00810, partial [Actinomycetia bacterium]|nr:hypothetical protein [Actinomycetes bacterium]